MRAKELRRILRYRAAQRLPALVGWMPSSWAEGFGSGVGACAYAMVSRDRGRAHRNLRRVYPGASEAEIRSMARRSWMELGKNIVDFVRYPRLSGKEREQLLDIEGLGKLESLRDEGRGAVVVSGHLGCWELIGAALKARGFPIKALARPLREQRLDHLLTEHRRAMNVHTVHAGSPREALCHLRSGGWLGILVDQRVPRGVRVDFLGQPTLITDAAARAAYACRAPLVCLTIARRGRGHRITVGSIVPPPASRDEIVPVTQTLARELSRCILARPMEWIWIHPRWEERSFAPNVSIMEHVA